MTIRALGFYGKTNPKGERCIDGGFRAYTVEDYNTAVRMAVAEVHGTDAIEMVVHSTPGVMNIRCGIAQFFPDKQEAIVVDLSKLTEVEKKRVAKIVKVANRNTPTILVNAE